MQTPQSGIITALLAFGLAFATPLATAQSAAPSTSQGSALAVPNDQLVQPRALADLLQSSGAARPLVLQVGSHVLYAEAHIPGSEYAGAGGQAEGLLQLQKRVAALPKKSFIVLYCGCCPWTRCPNIEPAYRKLHDMGFSNVKVLYLAQNFGADWVEKGYPVDRGR